MIKVKDIPWQAVDAICADNECINCPLRDKEKNKCMPYKNEYAEHEVEGREKKAVPSAMAFFYQRCLPLL